MSSARPTYSETQHTVLLRPSSGAHFIVLTQLEIQHTGEINSAYGMLHPQTIILRISALSSTGGGHIHTNHCQSQPMHGHSCKHESDSTMEYVPARFRHNNEVHTAHVEHIHAPKLDTTATHYLQSVALAQSYRTEWIWSCERLPQVQFPLVSHTAGHMTRTAQSALHTPLLSASSSASSKHP